VHAVDPGFVSTEWLVRGRGRAPRSDDDAAGRLAPGIAPERVAAAVADCLAARRSRTVSVPRWFGLTRLAAVPPVDRVLDAVLSHQAGRIRARVDGMVEARTG
jgi:hypothetical protein